jgi:hypothetical protein
MATETDKKPSPLSRPGSLTRPVDPNAPLKHVIAEYKHRAQTVTCVCGWHGSTETNDGRTSEWSLHVAANRGKRP